MFHQTKAAVRVRQEVAHLCRRQASRKAPRAESQHLRGSARAALRFVLSGLTAALSSRSAPYLCVLVSGTQPVG